jgi:hypothetical protein
MTRRSSAVIGAALAFGLAPRAEAFSGSSGGGGILAFLLIIVAGPVPWALIAGGLTGARSMERRPVLGAIVGVGGVGIVLMTAMLVVVAIHDRPDGPLVDYLRASVTHGLIPLMLPTLAGAAAVIALPLGTALAAVARIWPEVAARLMIVSLAGIVASLSCIAGHAIVVLLLLSLAGGAACLAAMVAALVVTLRPTRG